MASAIFLIVKAPGSLPDHASAERSSSLADHGPRTFAYDALTPEHSTIHHPVDFEDGLG